MSTVGSGNPHAEGRFSKEKYLKKNIEWLKEIYEPLTWKQSADINFWIEGYLKKIQEIAENYKK